MADTNINDNRSPESGGGSAVTVLVTIVIVAIIGFALYFGFVRGRGAAPAGGTNIDINATLPAGSGQTPAPNQ